MSELCTTVVHNKQIRKCPYQSSTVQLLSIGAGGRYVNLLSIANTAKAHSSLTANVRLNVIQK